MGTIRADIALSRMEIDQARLLVLRTAWKIDRYHDFQKVRRDIAAVKVAMPTVLHDVVMRAMQLHGALGVSDEMPFVKMLVAAQSLAIADGPTEVHKLTVARRTLREYEPVDTLFPSQHLPTRKAAARERLAELMEREVGDLEAVSGLARNRLPLVHQRRHPDTTGVEQARGHHPPAARRGR